MKKNVVHILYNWLISLSIFGFSVHILLLFISQTQYLVGSFVFLVIFFLGLYYADSTKILPFDIFRRKTYPLAYIVHLFGIAVIFYFMYQIYLMIIS